MTHAMALVGALLLGVATIVHEGRTYGFDQPEVVPMLEVEACFPASDQRSHRLFGLDECLRVRRVEPEVAGPVTSAG